ncbi:phenylalanine--tRNA ligase subunit alpha [Candidatus Dependentiae bacterium]|nr:phenylalanine--tRNA ligase subunit alpha [Candidatus Dependentiae bacterium]
MDHLVKKDCATSLALILSDLLTINNETALETLRARWLSQEGVHGPLQRSLEENPLKLSPEEIEKRSHTLSAVEKHIREAITEKLHELEVRHTPPVDAALLSSIVKKNYDKIHACILEDLSNTENKADLEAFRVRWIGRQGKIPTLIHELKERSLEEKRELGPLLNALKNSITGSVEEKEQSFEQRRIEGQALRFSHFDVTGYKLPELEGSLHPYTRVVEFVEDIFVSMGFELADGPELETDYYNFEALNIPKDHPARDMQDTFWLTLPGLLMRTHTSSVEIRTMANRKPPLAIVVPGRAYRNESTDASHDFMFMQLEGLFVDKGVSLAHLFATMKSFLQAFFEKKDITLKIRPSYFPFVEPGVEIDMSCPFCTSGCSVCKRTRWIEICGAGLCHPAVLRACGIDPREYSGFAFGFGLTRLVMLKYGITDIRLLHSNKIDFLKQF